MNNDELNNQFGKRLLLVRKKLNSTQKDFAKSLGISACNLSSIESGKSNPTVKLLNRMSHLYKVSMDYLFRGSGDMFLNDKNEKTGENREPIKSVDTIADMVWLAEHSKMFKNTVLGYAATYFYSNEENIRKTIQIKENQVEGKVD